MKFKYRRINLKDPFSKKKHIFRPIIPVSLRYKNQSIRYEALIDSGADFCIFPAEIAYHININMTGLPIIHFSGIEGGSLKGFISTIILEVGQLKVPTKVVFTESADTTGILGQQGFFDHFDVNLSYQKQIVEINPIKEFAS